MTPVAVTKEQLHILKHSIGGDGKHRNFFCTHDNDPELEALVLMGLMERGNTLNSGRDRYYHVTDAGKEFIR